VAAAPLIELILTPDQYATASPYELLAAAARGHAAIDHRWLRALLADRERLITDLLRFVREDPNRHRIDIRLDLVRIIRHLRAAEALGFLMDLVALYYADAPDLLAETICDFGAAAIGPLLQLYERFGPAGSSVVPFLLASLGVKDERIERVLREVEAADPEEGSFCREVYEEERSGQAAEAFDIWQEYPEQTEPPLESLPEQELLEFLESPSAEYRAAAVRSFGDQTELSGKILARLIELGRSDPDASVRAEVWRSLAGRDETIESLREELLARLGEESAPEIEKAGLVVALAESARHPLVRSWILRLYDNPATRARALEAMWRSLDRDFVRFFPRHLEDPDPDVAGEAVAGVGHLRITSELSRVERLFEHDELRPIALMAYTLAMPGQASPGRVEAMFRKVENLAGGLDPEEAEIVRRSLDARLMEAGYAPHYRALDEPDERETAPRPAGIGRNDPCPCGSGKKYKKCCGAAS
jgi:hypothetical protein